LRQRLLSRIRAGIKVFATGGIGGVHRGFRQTFRRICRNSRKRRLRRLFGRENRFDLPATREWLETHGVCVLGFNAMKCPRFIREKAVLTLMKESKRAEVAEIARARDELNLPNAILLTVPVPEKFEIEIGRTRKILPNRLKLAEKKNQRQRNHAVSAFANVEKSAGKTLAANIALLENNARNRRDAVESNAVGDALVGDLNAPPAPHSLNGVGKKARTHAQNGEFLVDHDGVAA
jgi:pseudouridine-5'-phosphate glycosidase